ncbi:MAG: hypothetical protein WD772_01315, partial [Pseudohongiellaceae bacterium]
SILKLRKKTSAVIGGLFIAGACMWGIAWWQDLTPGQLLNLFIGSLFLIIGVMIAALILVATAKLGTRLVRHLRNRKDL